MREILLPLGKLQKTSTITYYKTLFLKYHFIKIIANARHAAALRVLADFIFAFRFHFISHNHFPYLQTPH
jgi:ABC-type uncharacterized transport system YnjBCD substrate-binding protein